MQVEIYDEREIEPTTLKREDDAEAVALIEELGLTRQLNVSGNRIAYPTPNADQAFVMEVLFPQATKLEQYDAGGLPLRVLKEIRSYRAENPDHVLIVRHQAPAVLKDPVLLAYTEPNGPHPWMMTHRSPQWPKLRLIARWGDALDDWGQLLKRALEMSTAAYDEALAEIICKCEAKRTAIAKGLRCRESSPPTVHLG